MYKSRGSILVMVLIMLVAVGIVADLLLQSSAAQWQLSVQQEHYLYKGAKVYAIKY